MSKVQVLEQIYPDEIGYVLERFRTKELQRLELAITQMYAFAGGDGPKKWFEGIVDQYNYLIGQQKRDTEPKKTETTEEQLEGLKRMQNMIAQTKKTRRKPKGGETS